MDARGYSAGGLPRPEVTEMVVCRVKRILRWWSATSRVCRDGGLARPDG